MKRYRIWLGLGTAVLVAPQGAAAERPHPLTPEITDPAPPAAIPPALRFAQSRHSHPIAAPGGEGEGGEGEGEPASAELPPNLAFYRDLLLIRGHLLVGDELVSAGRWTDALPHFLHPAEEIYGNIRGRLKDYGVAPFQTALKSLAQTVKAKNREAYATALASLQERLDAAVQSVKAKESAWAPFALEAAFETLQVAAEEYEEAVDGKRIKNIVEYQDSRGFVWAAERVFEDVAGELSARDQAAVASIRAAFADLKAAWPSALPPKAPVKTLDAVLADLSKIELQLGRLR